jgi:hypothetical protein
MMTAGPALAKDPPRNSFPPNFHEPPPQKPAEPAPATSGMVTLHIESPEPVSLEKRNGAAWEHVCNSPCDGQVSVADEYRVTGENLNDSAAFLLDGSKGEKITLNVSPGSKKKYTTGIVLLGAGGALALGGVITIAAGASNAAVPGADGTTTTDKNFNIMTVGTVLIVAGVATGIGGGSLMVDNGRTHVEGPIAAPEEKKTDTKGPLNVEVHVSSRTPTWHEDAVTAPKAMTVPLLSGTF